MEERDGKFLSELPYTNRGVIRQEEELSAMIDWCQITIKEVSLEEVIEQVLKVHAELMGVTEYHKGIAGHELVAVFDNIKVLKPTGKAQYDGFQILMSGSGCRNYENFLQLNGGMGGTDERYRKDKAYYGAAGGEPAKSVGLAGKKRCPVIEAVLGIGKD